MRDRMSELAQQQQAAAATPAPVVVPVQEGSHFSGENASLAPFFEEVQLLREQIAAVAANTRRIDGIYTEALSSALEDQVSSGVKKGEDLITETNTLSRLVAQRLQAMKKEVERAGDNSVEARTKLGQHSALSQKFYETMREYQDVQVRCKERFRQRMQRQYRIVKPNATDQEMEVLMENNPGPVFSQQFLAANQRSEARKALQDIQDRHTEILKLEQSLRELHQLFVDMQVLVEAQGQQLNQVEDMADRAVNFTGKGVTEMAKAVKYKSSARKRMAILILCIVILLCVILIPILVTLIPRRSSNE